MIDEQNQGPNVMSKEEFKAIMDGFFEGIDTIKPADLPAFVEQVMNTVAEISEKDMGLGYSAAPVAVAACAVGAAWAANSHERAGGITGFQANFVMWEFIRRWMHKKAPMKLVDYELMLFPQYEDRFQPMIDESTWEWLRTEAKRRLNSEDGHPNVRAHWTSIAEGRVPFGYGVSGKP